MNYPQAIQDAAKILCQELKKHYPNVFNKSYDSHGFPNSSGSSFENRMQMGIYIELIKAGERFENEVCISDAMNAGNQGADEFALNKSLQDTK